MSDNNKPEDFFGEDSNFNSDNIRVEIPAQREPGYYDRIPSAYDPMGEIYARGRAMRTMSSGTMPWWVLITGWFLFGGLFLLIIFAGISSMSWGIIPSLIITLIPVLIVFRGTMAKLSATKRTRR
ncbi:hypothetical protein [Nostoc sp. CMAA1605]|uniref:hypothetical protein n=1 Tax=Nostoc sp. CMAA1605 TaxID=2055159 RepID=UPI001F46B76F|nr:hypothetical protein [Nostoc sp. CMAA1605]MCF4969534.1 hypothetical protein [Nostoc sp. CMAA1605]